MFIDTEHTHDPFAELLDIKYQEPSLSPHVTLTMIVIYLDPRSQVLEFLRTDLGLPPDAIL